MRRGVREQMSSYSRASTCRVGGSSSPRRRHQKRDRRAPLVVSGRNAGPLSRRARSCIRTRIPAQGKLRELRLLMAQAVPHVLAPATCPAVGRSCIPSLARPHGGCQGTCANNGRMQGRAAAAMSQDLPPPRGGQITHPPASSAASHVPSPHIHSRSGQRLPRKAPADFGKEHLSADRGPRQPETALARLPSAPYLTPSPLCPPPSH